MIKRTDTLTAFKIDQAVDLATSRGVLAAARFLDKQRVPVAISMRILGLAPGGKRAHVRSS